MQALAGLQIELAAEAKAATASRLLVEHLEVARVTLLLDLHASQGKHRVPLSIDTNRSMSAVHTVSAKQHAASLEGEASHLLPLGFSSLVFEMTLPCS